MQQAKTLEEYRSQCRQAMDDEFLRKAMDAFAVAIATGVALRCAKDAAVARLDELFAEFKAKAEKNGVHVHLARTAAEANEIIARIAREGGVKKIVKSKSMTA
jgi:L-lactate utilization protein LutB